MKPKNKRWEAIRMLISDQKINNQTDLLELLKEKGIESTQATLSRDIKQLKIIKVPDEKGGYFYRIPEMNIYTKKGSGNINTISSIEFSDTLAVVKTNPGYAMGIASDIDSLVSKEIMGTIAGDDTILLIPRKGISKTQIMNALSQILPSIREIKNDFTEHE